MYLILARLVLAVHFIWVVFVIFGVPLILIGAWRRWKWIRLRWLRLIHLFMVSFVALESLIGILCPLTKLEQALRLSAGEESYVGSFVAHGLSRLLYYNFEPWVFTVLYCFWCGLVGAFYFLIPPEKS